MAKERLSSTTIHIPFGEDDIEQLLRASSEEVNLVDTHRILQPHAKGVSCISEFTATRSGCLSFVTGAEGRHPQSSVSANKRTRGRGKKSKSPGPMQSEDQMSPRCASKTPPGAAKGVSSLSGETQKSQRGKNRASSFPRPAQLGRIFCQSRRERPLKH